MPAKEKPATAGFFMLGIFPTKRQENQAIPVNTILSS